MTRLALPLLPLLLLAASARPCWVAMEWGAALADSDLAVVATLERSEKPKPGFGTLRIHEVLLGTKPKVCTLRWTPANLLAPSGTMRHHHRTGQRFVYLLQKHTDGRYFANHPSRILKSDMVAKVRKAARGPLYRVRLEKLDVAAGEPVWAVLEIRTGQKDLTTDRRVGTDGDTLVLGGGVKLHVRGPGGTVLEGRVRDAAKAKAVTIKPDEPFRLRVDLRRHFDLKPGAYYSILLGEGEQRRSHPASFRIAAKSKLQSK